MNFAVYPKLHQVADGDSPYADAINHCERYNYYSVRGQRVTSVHECTHGINSQLRNRPLQTPLLRNYAIPSTKAMDLNDVVACSQPLPADEFASTTAGFYLLEDRAIILANPAGTISEAARLVPSSMRYSRFNLYLVKQAASWNNEPLYIYDEWVAYRNGAACLIYDAQHGGTRDGNTDFIFAPLEFCTYAIAVMKMASAHGPIADDLRDFTHWLLTDCFNLYFVGKRYAPWAQADRLFDQMRGSPDFAPLREFAAAHLGFTIPDGVVDPDRPTNVLL